MILIAWVIRSCLENCLETSGNHKEVIGEAFFKKLRKATPKKVSYFIKYLFSNIHNTDSMNNAVQFACYTLFVNINGKVLLYLFI